MSCAPAPPPQTAPVTSARGGAGPTFEHELRAAQDPGGVHAAAVAAPGVEGEGGVLAHGVRVVVVMSFPAMVVVVEDEVACQEEDLRPHLAALAHPLAVQPHRQVRLGGQQGRPVLVGAVDYAAGDAGVVVVLQPRHKLGKDGVQEGSANAQPSPPQGTVPLTRVPEGAGGHVCPPVLISAWLVGADGRARPKYFSCDLKAL